PSWNVMSPYPSGTTILLPLVMMCSEALVLEPRPASWPRATPGKSAAVGSRLGGGLRKSFHLSAIAPPSEPANALMNPIFVPMFPSLVLTVLWSISGPMSLGNFAHKALTTDVLLSGNTWRAQQIDVHHPTGFGLGTPARGGNIVAHGIDFPGY